jgi:hypothetical protein
MALLQTNQIKPTGEAQTLVAATAGGDTYQTGDTAFLVAKNGGTGPVTITLEATAEEFGQPITSPTATVAAGETAFIGPLASEEFNNETTDVASLTYSGVTSLTVGIFSF